MASLHQSLSYAPNVYEIKTNSISVPQQTVLEIDHEAHTVAMEAVNASRRNNNGREAAAAGGTRTEEMPICLTWKDLWVTASVAKNESRSILQGLTGYAKPGQLLAIMGPSGCGKSTLLDALGGTYIKVKLLCMIPFSFS